MAYILLLSSILSSLQHCKVCWVESVINPKLSGKLSWQSRDLNFSFSDPNPTSVSVLDWVLLGTKMTKQMF